MFYLKISQIILLICFSIIREFLSKVSIKVMSTSFNETINSASDTIKSISNDYHFHKISEFASDIINNYDLHIEEINKIIRKGNRISRKLEPDGKRLQLLLDGKIQCFNEIREFINRTIRSLISLKHWFLPSKSSCNRLPSGSSLRLIRFPLRIILLLISSMSKS